MKRNMTDRLERYFLNDYGFVRFTFFLAWPMTFILWITGSVVWLLISGLFDGFSWMGFLLYVGGSTVLFLAFVWLFSYVRRLVFMSLVRKLEEDERNIASIFLNGNRNPHLN